MTSEHREQEDREQQERRLVDEQCVDALLAESGLEAGTADDDGLRDILLRLRSFRGAEVPQPCPELAALLGWAAGPGDPAAEVVRLADRPRKNAPKKRAVFTTLAVAASLGIASGAAAGSETVRRHAEGTVSNIVRLLSPPEPAAPAPAQPAEAPGPAPAVVPSPAWMLPPALDSTPSVGTPAPRTSGPGQPDGGRPETPARLPKPPEQYPAQDAAPAAPAPQPDHRPAGPQETPAILPLPANPAEGPAGDKAKGKAAGERPGTGRDK